MAASRDLQLSDNDLTIKNGDFAIADSDMQHIEDIVTSHPGWWKQYPSLGVGAYNYLASPGQAQKLAREIKLQLTADGFTVSNPRVSFDANGELIIDPNAVRD